MRHSSGRLVIALSIALLACLAYILYDRGGPYFDAPATIFDHVSREPHPARGAILLIRDIRPLLPRGAEVTCFRPLHGKWQYDTPSFHAAVAELPHQFVLPPFSAAEGLPKSSLVEYVIAVGTPFTHPDYRLDAEYPAGRLYKVAR